MRKLVLYLIVLVDLSACNQVDLSWCEKPIGLLKKSTLSLKNYCDSSSYNQKDILKTGTLNLQHFCDTVPYNKDNKYIILPVEINGTQKKLILDTGADLSLIPEDVSEPEVKVNIRDVNGIDSVRNLNWVKKLKISNCSYSDLFAVTMDLPEPFLCFCDGLIGNNVIKSANLLIEENQVIFSDEPFDLLNKSLILPFFYYGANRLFSNITLNNCPVDTCLFDYGTLDEIKLPLNFYEKFKSHFKTDKIIYRIETSYGANGKSSPDTTLSLYCKIDLNGIKIDNVNVVFKKNCKKRLGLGFLKRFNKVIINNSTNQLLFGELKGYQTINRQKTIYSFDLIEGYFVISSKVLNEHSINDFNVGDKFIEINSMKSKDFKNYCDFITWKDNLIQEEYLELRILDNKVAKINNWYDNGL